MANWRCAVGLGLGLVAGCGGDGDGLAAGTLAYVDVDGALAILDLGSGAQATIPVAEGPPLAITLSPDAQRVAFAVDRGDRGRSVHTSDRSGPPQEIDPGTGSLMPAFFWGVGGYFRYGRANSTFTEHVVLAGETTSRQLGDAQPRDVVLSPTDAVLAYSACVPPGFEFDCPVTLTVERADGTPIASAELPGALELLAFTADGDAVVTIEQDGAERQLAIRTLDALETRQDLATVDRVHYGFSGYTPRDEAISPDGREIVAQRDGALVAIDLTDGTVRLIAEASVGEIVGAVFTPTGELVYRIEQELPPFDDTPEYLYHLWLADADGPVAVASDENECFNSPTVSPSGALAAWSCGGEVLVMSLAERRVIRRVARSGYVAGFTQDDTGLIVAFELDDSLDYDLTHVTLGGEQTSIATGGAFTSSGGAVERASYDFVP